MIAACFAASAPTAGAAGITNAADDARTGWYRDQSALTPSLVQSTAFGQMSDTALQPGEQIDAQPLVVGDKVVVATERNHVYGIDAAANGASATAIKWHRA